MLAFGYISSLQWVACQGDIAEAAPYSGIGVVILCHPYPSQSPTLPRTGHWCQYKLSATCYWSVQWNKETGDNVGPLILEGAK